MFATRVAFLYYAKIFRMAINMAGSMMIARLLDGPEVMGMNSYAGTFIGAFWFLADFSLESAHVKMLASGKDPGKCVGTLLTMKLILSAVTAVLILSAVAFTKHYAGGFADPVQETVLHIWLAANLFDNVMTFAPYTFLARKEVAKSAFIDIAKSAVNLAVIIILIFVKKADAVGIALSHAGANVFGGLLSIYWFRGYPLARPSRALFNEYFKFTFPLLFVIITIHFNVNIDRVLLGGFYGASEVGYFHGADRITTIILFISGAATALLMPSLAEYFARGDLRAVERLMRRSERYLSLMTLPLVLMAFLVAPQLVRAILGRQFDNSVPIFQMLIWVTYFTTLSRPSSVLMMSAGRTRLVTFESILSTLLCFSFYITFIPKTIFGVTMLGWGGKGAAAAECVNAVLGIFMTKWFCSYFIGIRPYWKFLYHLFAAAVPATLFLFLQFHLQYGPAVAIPLHTVGGVGLFLFLMKLGGEFSREDIVYIWNNVRPGKVGGYVKQELSGKESSPAE